MVWNNAKNKQACILWLRRNAMKASQIRYQNKMSKHGKETQGIDRLNYAKHKNRVFWFALIISCLVHFISYFHITLFSQFVPDSKLRLESHSKKIMKVEFKELRREQEYLKQPILETKLQKTVAPEKKSYLGFQNHIAQKQLRSLKRSIQNKDEIVQKKNNQKESVQRENTINEGSPQKLQKKSIEKKKFGNGEYRRLFPESSDLTRAIEGGYRDYLDKKIEQGDRVDINTSNFRFIGYFTALKKALELVWIYPFEARSRGLEGAVSVEFIINRDGGLKSVRVIQSSGYKILDDAVIDALRLASPFTPLPDGLGKEKLLVTGSFHYVLSRE